MRIGVVGNGVVGSATAHAFQEKCDVRVYDQDEERSKNSLLATLDSDIVFVCLPTPQLKHSLKCDLTALNSFFGNDLLNAGQHFRQANFVLKSTVPIGTTKQFAEHYALPNLVHSPEFLTARTAFHDAAHPTRNIIGKLRQVGRNAHSGSRLWSLYCDVWPNVPCYHMTSDESEAVKLFQNAFSAVKIAFFNEIKCFADLRGLDWKTVLQALLAGGWINPMHTQVPGPDGKPGFGGSCLPKDLASLIAQMDYDGVNTHVLEAAWQYSW